MKTEIPKNRKKIKFSLKGERNTTNALSKFCHFLQLEEIGLHGKHRENLESNNCYNLIGFHSIYKELIRPVRAESQYDKSH